MMMLFYSPRMGSTEKGIQIGKVVKNKQEIDFA